MRDNLKAIFEEGPQIVPARGAGNKPLRVCCGFCTLYPGGPHVLVTIDDGHGGDLEAAITPSDARKLAKWLTAAARGLEQR